MSEIQDEPDFRTRTPVALYEGAPPPIREPHIDVSALPDLTAGQVAIAPLPQAYTIPATWYTHTAFHQADQQVLIAQHWQYVGHTSQFAERGDALFVNVAGEPVVVVHDTAVPEGFRAFFNVCLHRAGSLAVRKHAQRPTFQCQYHGWTYFLDGMLRGVPDWDRVELFDKEAYALRPVRLAIWEGLIFVDVSGRAPDLSTVMAGIAERIRPYDLASKRFYRQDKYEIHCNWKVYMDNYLEGYHIPIVHPELNRILDYRQYVVETAEYYSLQTSPLQTDEANVYSGLGADGQHAFYYTIFPNFMLNIAPGRLQTNVVVPLAPNRCLVVFDYFYDEAVLGNETAIAQEIAYSDLIQQEDIEVCEKVQMGLQSRAYQQGRFSVKREEGVYHFQRLVKQAYGRVLANSAAPP